MNEVFLPLVPLHVLKRIAEEGKVTPGITPVRSVLLYTDISGFTALTETLTSSGKEGIEEVTKILNAHFGRLSDILAEHKGILLKLGGDSLLAKFTGQDAVESGSQAAWEMFDWFKEHPKISTSQGAFSLSMKAILGGGDYFEAILGDEEKVDWFPLGEVIQELASAEKEVSPGDLVVKKNLRNESFPEESYPEIAVAEREKLVELTRTFLPVGRSTLLGLSTGGEYRVVAPIFLNIEGYDPARPDFESLNEFYLSLYKLVRRYHGTINKVDLALQGSKMLVLFGAPVSHEANRTNAAGFFRELSSISSRFTLKAGISYGAAFAGFIGGSEKEYTVIGQRVNAAAKIMSASDPGEFVITAEAAEKLSDIYETEELSPVEIRGVTYKRFKLSGTKKPSVSALGEWKTHDEEAEQATKLASGRSQLVGVTGDHGMGKSRFLKRLGENLSGTHEVISVTLDEKSAPYQVFRHILVRRAAIREDDPADVKYRKLKEHLQQTAEKAGEKLDTNELLRRLPFMAGMLFGLDLAQRELALYSPELRLENLMDGFRSYLLNVAGPRPLAVLVDDLDMGDTGSLEMLAFATRTIPRLKPQGVNFFLAYDHEFETSFQQGFGLECEKITLGALSLLQSKDLAEQILGGEADQAVHQFLYERSLGNPSVLEQWAGYLLDKGLLVNQDGLWVMGEGVDTTEIPDDLYSLVFSRLDRLNENTRQALKLGAVYGMHFPAPVVAHVLGIENVTAQLAPAVSAGLVYPLEAGEVEYVFHQTLVRDVCYDSLLRDERERFHKEVTKSIETLYAASLDRYLAVLANHSIEAGDWDRAFDYSLRSAKENQRLFRNEASEEDYSKTIDIWEEHFKEGRSKEMFDTYFGRAGVYEYQGRFPEAAKDYAKARNLAIRKGLTENEVDAANKLAYVSRFLSDFEHLFEYADEALRRSETLGYKKGKAVACLERGAGYARQGQPEEAEADFQAALSLSQEVGDAENANRSLNNLATLNRFIGRTDESLAYYEKATALAEKTEDKLLLANNLLNIARLLLQLGKPDTAQSYLERALRNAMEIGHRATIVKCTIELSAVQMRSGNMDEAHSLLEEASIRADELQDPELEGEVEINLGTLSYFTGNLEETLSHYQRALEFRKMVGEPNRLADAYANLGNILPMIGKKEEALLNLEEAHKLFIEAGNPSGAARTLGSLASLNITSGRFTEGLAQAEKALELIRETGDTWTETEVCLTYAEANFNLARYEETLRLLEDTEEILEEPSMAQMALDALRLRALTYTRLGRLNDGLFASQRAMELARRNENPQALFANMAVHLENLIGSGDVEAAVVEMVELQDIERELGNPALKTTSRLIAARINLANGMHKTAAEILTEIKDELGEAIEDTEKFTILQLLAEAKAGQGERKEAENCVLELLEHVKDRPLYYQIASSNLVLASLAEKRIKFAEAEPQVKKPSLSSLLVHPLACAKWSKYQKAAAKALAKVVKPLSPENAEALTGLFASKGLSVDKLTVELKLAAETEDTSSSSESNPEI